MTLRLIRDDSPALFFTDQRSVSLKHQFKTCNFLTIFDSKYYTRTRDIVAVTREININISDWLDALELTSKELAQAKTHNSY